MSFFYYATILACTQHHLVQDRHFSYSLYQAYIMGDIKFDLYALSDIAMRTTASQSELDELTQILAEANAENGTNISIPNHILSGIITTNSPEEVQEFLINNNILTPTTINHLEIFTDEVLNNGFDVAIDEYESIVTASDITDDEFLNADNTASTFKILNEENPDVFKNPEELSRIAETSGLGWCLVNYVMWIAALITLIGGCATLFLCALSVTLFMAQTIRTVKSCGEYLEQ